MPANAGNTRCPMLNTMTARNPTVSACREAPQMPLAFCVRDAQMPSAPATSNHAYAERTNHGKLACTPDVFEGRILGWKILNATIANTAP